jgi:hypothetical protein
MLKKSCILTLLIGSISLSAVYGARPFITDDAGTVEERKFEVEITGNYWKDASTIGGSIKHGITERMDLGVCVDHCYLPEDERAFSGENISIKFALIPDLLSLSFGAEFGSNDYAANGILSKSFGSFEGHLNLGYEVEGSLNKGFITYSTACVFTVGRAGLGVEIGGNNEERSLDFWQLGGRWSIFDWLQVDTAIGSDFEEKPQFIMSSGLWFFFPIK